MNDPDDLSTASDSAPRDPVAELMRALGRRPAPPAEHYESVRAASHATWQAKVASRRRRRFAYALAASLALATVTAFVLDTLLSPPEPVATLALAAGDAAARFSASSGEWQPLADTNANVYAGDRLRTGSNARAAFVIGHSGSLRMNVNTEMVVSATDAFELVSGMLYIDSGETQSAEPLEIATAHGIVRDVGTQFEVYSTADTLRVRVRSGSVRLVDSPHTDDLRRVAGEELELSASGSIMFREIAPDDARWGWAAAVATVPAGPDSTLAAYFQWIARELGKPLRFDSPSTELRAQLELWRGDARGLTPHEMLDSMVATSDFLVELGDDGAMLVHRK